MNTVSAFIKKGSKKTAVPFRVDNGNNRHGIVFPDGVTLKDGQTLVLEFDLESGKELYDVDFVAQVREVQNV